MLRCIPELNGPSCSIAWVFDERLNSRTPCLPGRIVRVADRKQHFPFIPHDIAADLMVAIVVSKARRSLPQQVLKRIGDRSGHGKRAGLRSVFQLQVSAL